jgi:hypothetical protein
MKQYLLSIVYPPGSAQPPPDELQKIMRNVMALQQEMKDAGAWVFSGGLAPASSATMLHHRGNDIVTMDGPYAETKEQIGGFTILRAPDLDAALAWGRRLARAVTTPVEVRPFMEHSG